MKKQNGFTVIEVLLAAAVIGVLTTVAVPGVSAGMKNDRQISLINALQASLVATRAEAIKDETDVSICAGSTPACKGTSWADGWVIYRDTPNNGAAPQVIETVAPAGNRLSFASNDGYRFTFHADGTASPAPANLPLTFTVCDSRGAAHARAIHLSVTGRPLIAAQVGYAFDSRTPLTCPGLE